MPRLASIIGNDPCFTEAYYQLSQAALQQHA
jgi:hypothetical protein